MIDMLLLAILVDHLAAWYYPGGEAGSLVSTETGFRRAVGIAHNGWRSEPMYELRTYTYDLGQKHCSCA